MLKKHLLLLSKLKTVVLLNIFWKPWYFFFRILWWIESSRTAFIGHRKMLLSFVIYFSWWIHIHFFKKNLSDPKWTLKKWKPFNTLKGVVDCNFTFLCHCGIIVIMGMSWLVKLQPTPLPCHLHGLYFHTVSWGSFHFNLVGKSVHNNMYATRQM